MRLTPKGELEERGDLPPPLVGVLDVVGRWWGVVGGFFFCLLLSQHFLNIEHFLNKKNFIKIVYKN
jgi:hypothetical protein